VDASAEGAVYFLGVLADALTNTLWACQIYSPPPGGSEHSALRGFDLKTGSAKFRWELPGSTNLCNDFVVGPDKALYISDTFVGDTLYENNVIFNKLYRVPVDTAGKAGKPIDIWLDKPIKGPDGMRAANGKLFLTENDAGKLDMVTVSGDTAAVTVLKDGLAVPTSIEPAGGELWYGELEADRAQSMPLPK
jgi:hypothetical protein